MASTFTALLILLVNLVNMLFWFIMKPTDERDPIKTIVTSMAAVLTTSMSLRIILSVRGSLVSGGSFALSNSTGATSSRTTHVISGARSGGAVNGGISTHGAGHTYTLDELRSKPEGEWGVVESESDERSSAKGMGIGDNKYPVDKKDGTIIAGGGGVGVKITIDREVVGFDEYGKK
ncbi:hypothetical protein CVT24_004820 [Panaeolus cyanescens]|uniref:Uncharacterized protein n=1 Tax=Panaeolus cyanescens TaxID=181874 RepID=A0A409VQ28_9AGAR|nr:hypothetical protein CVT24_004820 [Panaeolus cyanescens]